MNPRRPPALAAHLAPLPSAQRGFEAELSLKVPSDVERVSEAVDLVTRHVAAHFSDRRTVNFNLRVALGEALTNAILYGNRSDAGKLVAVRVLFGHNVIELEVTDQGPGFDPSSVPDPTSPERIEQPSGRGLFLIRRLMDDVRFNDKGNSICMMLRRE